MPSHEPGADTLAAQIDAMKIGRDAESGWRDLRPTILGLIDRTRARKVLEIGGGRFPFLTLDETRTRGVALTVNDRLSSELEKAARRFRKELFRHRRRTPGQRRDRRLRSHLFANGFRARQGRAQGMGQCPPPARSRGHRFRLCPDALVPAVRLQQADAGGLVGLDLAADRSGSNGRPRTEISGLLRFVPGGFRRRSSPD